MSTNAIVRLIYASTATFVPQRDPNGIEVQVGRILMQSRRNNAREQIGGVLHYGDGYFFQCLEGDRDRVNRTYQRISEDPRHKDLHLLAVENVEQRMFQDWSMKYVTIEQQVNDLLKRHRLKQFNPYAFEKPMIHDLLLTCVEASDPSRGVIPDQPASSDPRPRKSGLFGRLFGR